MPPAPGPARMVSSRAATKARSSSSKTVTACDSRVSRGSGLVRISITATSADQGVDGRELGLDAVMGDAVQRRAQRFDTGARLPFDMHDVDGFGRGAAHVGFQIEDVQSGLGQCARDDGDEARMIV